MTKSTGKVLNRKRSKWSTDKFIERSKELYPGKFGYEKTIFNGIEEPSIFECLEHHREFVQVPHSHLRNHLACPDCQREIGILEWTTEELIKASINKFGDRFAYEDTVCKGICSLTIFRCVEHNEKFSQRANGHLDGHIGCIACKKAIHNKTIWTTETFIAASRAQFGDQFGYGKFIYTSFGVDSIFTCNQHSLDFLQTPKGHLLGQAACSKCHKEQNGRTHWTTESFIEASKDAFGSNKFGYAKFEFNGVLTESQFECLEHNKSFRQIPRNHLQGSLGCQDCKDLMFAHRNRMNAGSVGAGGTSKVEGEWLDYLGVDKQYRGLSITIGEKRFIVDALDETNKVAYEFFGTYWHSDPRKYDPSDMHTVIGTTHGENYAKSMERIELLKSAGYTVVVMWEMDWDEHRKALKKTG